MSKKMLLAAALFVGLGASAAPTQAAVVQSFGTLNVPATVSFSDTMAGGVFENDYLFKVDSPGTGNSAAVTINLGSSLGITGLNYSFYSSATSGSNTPSSLLAGPVASPGPLTFAGFLDNTQYFLRLAGTALSGGGSYGGALNVVPLPGAALLFGSALAGLGWMRRRRDGGLPAAAAA